MTEEHQQGADGTESAARTFACRGPGEAAVLLEFASAQGPVQPAEPASADAAATVEALQALVSEHGSAHTEPESVTPLFAAQGRIVLQSTDGEPPVDPEALLMAVLMSGADDSEPGRHEREVVVTCQPSIVEVVRDALRDAELPVRSAHVGWVPHHPVTLTGDSARAHRALLRRLREHPSVLHVWTNVALAPPTDAAPNGG